MSTETHWIWNGGPRAKATLVIERGLCYQPGDCIPAEMGEYLHNRYADEAAALSADGLLAPGAQHFYSVELRPGAHAVAEPSHPLHTHHRTPSEREAAEAAITAGGMAEITSFLKGEIGALRAEFARHESKIGGDAIAERNAEVAKTAKRSAERRRPGRPRKTPSAADTTTPPAA